MPPLPPPSHSHYPSQMNIHYGPGQNQEQPKLYNHPPQHSHSQYPYSNTNAPTIVHPNHHTNFSAPRPVDFHGQQGQQGWNQTQGSPQGWNQHPGYPQGWNQPQGYPQRLNQPLGYHQGWNQPQRYPQELNQPQGYPQGLNQPLGYPQGWNQPQEYSQGWDPHPTHHNKHGSTGLPLMNKKERSRGREGGDEQHPIHRSHLQYEDVKSRKEKNEGREETPRQRINSRGASSSSSGSSADVHGLSPDEKREFAALIQDLWSDQRFAQEFKKYSITHYMKVRDLIDKKEENKRFGK